MSNKRITITWEEYERLERIQNTIRKHNFSDLLDILESAIVQKDFSSDGDKTLNVTQKEIEHLLELYSRIGAKKFCNALPESKLEYILILAKYALDLREGEVEEPFLLKQIPIPYPTNKGIRRTRWIIETIEKDGSRTTKVWLENIPKNNLIAKIPEAEIPKWKKEIEDLFAPIPEKEGEL